MPIYQFKCTKCEYEFEEFKNWVIYNNKPMIQGVPTLRRCPKCQNIAKKIIKHYSNEYCGYIYEQD